MSNMLPRCIRALAGLYLLVGAFLKILAPGQSVFSVESPRFSYFVIEVEILLGLLLLTGIQKRLITRFAICFFCGLGVVSGMLFVEGRSNCGCFGNVTVNPLVTMLADFAFFIMLIKLLVKEERAEPEEKSQIHVWTISGTLIVIGLLIHFIGSTALTIQPRYFLPPSITNEFIVVDPEVLDIGAVKAGSVVHAEIDILNRTGQKVVLTGGDWNCTTCAISDLPKAVRGSQRETVRIQVKVGTKPGKFARAFRIFTNLDTQPILLGRVVADVL
jgi:hypothetical protein